MILIVLAVKNSINLNQIFGSNVSGDKNEYEEYIKRITELNFVSSSENLMRARLVLLIFEEIGHLVFR